MQGTVFRQLIQRRVSCAVALALLLPSVLHAGSTTYTYDASGRLAVVAYPAKTQGYAYDGAANLTRVSSFAITKKILPVPVVAVAYNQTVATRGGATPITFSLAGTLPAGLTFTTTTGVISGTPTATGAYSFTVTATDHAGLVDSQVYAGTVSTAPSILTSTLPVPVLTKYYSQTLAESGGAPPVTFSVATAAQGGTGPMPAGLSLAPIWGTITGTPTTSGAYAYKILATDALGVLASRYYSGTIAALPAITTTTLPTPVRGTPYTGPAIGVSGGTAAFSFAVTAGALPANLAINHSNGVISGTATTAGTYNFTVTVTDANGLTASQPYQWVIS